MLILAEFWIDLSRSFHSIITEGKKEFLIWEIVFKTKKRYISRQSCVMRGGLKR